VHPVRHLATPMIRREKGEESGSGDGKNEESSPVKWQMQARIRTEPDVCPFIKRVDCDKTKGSCAHILITRKRPFIQAF